MPEFPLCENTDIRRAIAHQLYCFAIEVGFGANADRDNIGDHRTEGNLFGVSRILRTIRRSSLEDNIRVRG